MKRLLVFILVLSMLLLPIVSCDMAGGELETDTSTDAPVTEAPDTGLRAEDENLYVGYARECITPYAEDGSLLADVKLDGYAETRYVRSVKDELYASCTAVKDDEGNTALLFTLDLHSMKVDLAKSLAKNLERELGIPEENIILNVTHTHAAPFAANISDILMKKTLAAAKAALDDLTLVTELYTGNVEIPNMNFIRRYDNDQTPTKHLWDNDPYMPTVKFVREGKKAVILCNWAAHCDTVKGNSPTAVSADYVAYFRQKIEAETDAYISFHLGASGDVNPKGRLEGESTFAGTSRYGTQLANLLLSGLDTLERQTIKSRVASDIEKVKIAYDHSDDAAHGPQSKEIMDRYFAGEGLSVEIQKLLKEYGFASIYDAMYTNARYKAGEFDRMSVGAISIGNVVFGVAPYEMFTVNGKNIKASADEFDLAFVCAYSNGMIGYIASEEAFDYDIYEVQSRLYVKETATVLQDSIIASIDKLAE